jgi:hypothetical protein
MGFHTFYSRFLLVVFLAQQNEPVVHDQHSVCFVRSTPEYLLLSVAGHCSSGVLIYRMTGCFRQHRIIHYQPETYQIQYSGTRVLRSTVEVYRRRVRFGFSSDPVSIVFATQTTSAQKQT